MHWLGFDCGHCDDYQPGLMKYMPDVAWDTQYRDVEYVQCECRNLASQVINAGTHDTNIQNAKTA